MAAGFGVAFAWLLFVGGFLTAFRGNLLGGVWLFFLGTFLRNAAQSSVAYAQLQELLGGVRVAEMMRPQLGSLPCIAVFTSGLSAIARAIFRASDSLFAPSTIIRTTFVAPSPSAAI